VRSARINRQFRLVPRGYPAGVHEQGIVKQRIGRADGEQGGAQPLQVRIEGGDIGRSAIRDGRQEAL